jgi:hypothetical protein
MSLPNVDAIVNSFSEKDLTKSTGNTRKTMTDGLYQWVVQGAKMRTIEKGKLAGTFEISLRVSAVGEEGTPIAGTTQFVNCVLPYSNPEIAGHSAPEWAKGMSAKLCAIVDPTNHVVPRKNKATGQYELNGEPVDKTTTNQAYDRSRAATVSTLAKLVKEADANEGNIPSLKDEAFFAPLETNEEGYQNVSLFGASTEAVGEVIRSV